MDGDELHPEPLGSVDTFALAMQEVAIALRDGHGELVIERIDREGDEADHVELAYVAKGVDISAIPNLSVVPIRIVRPEDVPPEWRPSQPVRTVDGVKMKPLLDPAQMAGRNELMYQVERLPHYQNTSWKNDVSPSRVFAIGDVPYKMFIAPARIIARNAEQGQQFAIFKIEREQGQAIDEAIEEEEIDWDPVVDTEDPMVVLRWLAEHAHGDASAERFRLLDLENKRRSARKGRDLPEFDDSEQRFALLDLGDDPAVNPARCRGRRRRNPDDIAAAKEKFEEFHRHKPRKLFESGESPIPAKVRELGKAKAVLYRSDKNDPDTGRPVKKPIDYIHDHDAGVRAYTPAAGGMVDVPAFIRDAEALVLLGKCLGFDFEDGSGKVREAKGIRPLPDLYATPCGKALLVIQDRRDVLAIVWGGGLGVEARGIVG